VINILPTSEKLSSKLTKYGLTKKFEKQQLLLSQNPRHPGLHVELLLPKEFGVYSFRIDRKFRALFIYRPDLSAIEILNITVHYH